MTDSINQYKSAAKHDGQRLKDGLQAVSDSVGHVRDEVVSVGRGVAETARGGIEAAKSEVSKTVHAAQERGEQAISAVNDQVTSRPLTSLGVALGVGILLGMFVLRPRA